MKTGKNLVDLATEVMRRAEAKRDFLADSRELKLFNGNEMHVSGQGEFEMLSLAHQQLAGEVDMPWRFYERLRGQHPTLLDTNVNTLLPTLKRVKMVRTLDGQVRALLSDRYRRLENEDVAAVVLPILGELPDAKVPSCEVTDTRLYISAYTERFTAEPKVGDPVCAGVRITNSEVGLGSLRVDMLIYRLVCTNGMTAERLLRQFHVGGRLSSNEAAEEIFKDDTIKADDEAFFLKVRDAVRAAVDETQFQRVVDKLRQAGQTPEIADVSAGVQEIGKRLSLSQDESKNVLHYLARGGDLTQYGAVQAVTRAAQDVQSYDRSMELEALGGTLLGMTPREWQQIAHAVPA